MKYNPTREIVAARRVPENQSPRDLAGKDGATELAAELDAWWHARGYPAVHHWVECKHVRPMHATHNAVWCVRSNLVNGVPPKGPSPLTWSDRNRGRS